MEWLKVKALSSNPSTTKKKKKKSEHPGIGMELSVEHLPTMLRPWVDSKHWRGNK
jgi:hypothetical protein